MMKRLRTGALALYAALRSRSSATWRWYRARPRWQQAVIAAILAALLIGAIALARSGGTEAAATPARAVTVASVASMSGTGSSLSVIGTVRSIAEANILAQSGGTVQSVRTKLGANVPAGFVIAELSNASEAAAVLQAQGAYDAAIAARNITLLQSGNAQTSFTEAQASARESYRSAYTSMDTVLSTYVSALFGMPTIEGPQLLINEGPTTGLSRQRAAIEDMMEAWARKLPAAESTNPETLLSEATQNVTTISTFLNELNRATSAYESNATAAQVTALATARSTVATQLASLSAARDAYNAKKTAAQVGTQQSSSQGAQVASADAAVKQALGSLRAAQAVYERTIVRAPIGGTVNYLSLRPGAYVTAMSHVATVAQNGALEIVSYVTESERENLSVGMQVLVNETNPGVVTAISPALDPVTKQIEVRIALTEGSDLIDGQSVRIGFPQVVSETPVASGPVLLPLASVKLLADARVVFSVDAEGRLVAHPVTIGDVRGDRIEVLSGVTPELMIVADARGLAEGQKVQVATP